MSDDNIKVLVIIRDHLVRERRATAISAARIISGSAGDVMQSSDQQRLGQTITLLRETQAAINAIDEMIMDEDESDDAD